MREWVINEYSGYQGLRLQECQKQIPSEGEVRIRVEAFALNWGDSDLMKDNYSFSFPSLPARIGVECAGIIDQVEPGVDAINLGQRYCTLPYFYADRGVSADSIIVNAKHVVKAPKGLSAIESAAVWMKYTIAYFPLVELAKVDSQSTVLVTAATGTAGTAAVEIARMCGAKVIATSRHQSNSEYLLNAGASEVFIGDDKSKGLADMIDRVSAGKGVNVVFDPVGGEMMDKYSSVLAQDAKIFFYGFLTGEFPKIPFIDLFNKNTIFHPYSVFHYLAKPELCAKATEFIYRSLEQGKLSPEVDKVFPMQGYKFHGSDPTMGKFIGLQSIDLQSSVIKLGQQQL